MEKELGGGHQALGTDVAVRPSQAAGQGGGSTRRGARWRGAGAFAVGVWLEQQKRVFIIA